MARSENDTLNDETPSITDDRTDLPEGEARLVIEGEEVTTVIQGAREEVEQRLYEEIAADFGTTVEEVTDIDEYPMPDPLDDEPV